MSDSTVVIRPELSYNCTRTLREIWGYWSDRGRWPLRSMFKSEKSIATLRTLGFVALKKSRCEITEESRAYVRKLIVRVGTMRVKISVALSEPELSVLKDLQEWLLGHTRSPKKWEFVGFKSRNRMFASECEKAKEKAFDRLVRLGLIIHSKNGHCRLSKEGSRIAKNDS